MTTTVACLAMSTTWWVILFLSSNGGGSWMDLVATGTKSTGAVDWAVDASIHWAGSVMFEPFNGQSAWVTSGDGVFKSTNVSGARPDWTFNVNGPEETVVVGAVSVPGSPLITALGDVEGSRHDTINCSNGQVALSANGRVLPNDPPGSTLT
jgi:hypothetical protein